MNLISIIAVLLISLLFTVVFVVGLKSRGPWGSGWTFFTIICLWLAAVSLWIPPAGPVWGGVAWIDLFFTGLLVSFVMSATSISTSSSVHALEGDQSNIGDQPNINESIHHANKVVETGKERMGASTQETIVADSPGRKTEIYISYDVQDHGFDQKKTFKTGSIFWLILACLFALIIIGVA